MKRKLHAYASMMYSGIMAMRKRRLRTRAITLIEIMVVLLIIGLVSTFIAINLSGTVDKAKIDTAKIQMKEFAKVLEAYRIDNGTYPTTAQGLRALLEKPVTEPIPNNYPSGGYLTQRSLPKDPWGNPYVYEFPDPNDPDRFLLKSLGSDGKEGGDGTAADIVSD